MVGGVAAGKYGLGTNICLADTWQLSADGSTWTRLTTPGGSDLPTHTGAGLVYMSAPVPLLVLIGGNFGSPCSDANEAAETSMATVWMFALSDRAWKAGSAYEDPKHGLPAARHSAALATIPDSSGAARVIMAGGLSTQEGNLLKDVWELDLTRSFTSDTRGVWRKLGELPALSAQAEAVYHPPSGLVYLHGGYRQEADGEVFGRPLPSDGLLQLEILQPGDGERLRVQELEGSGVSRQGHVSWLASIAGKDYVAVAGGLGEADPLDQAMQLYDLTDGVWLPTTGETPVATLAAGGPSQALKGAAAVSSVDGSWALILGGFRDGSTMVEGELLAEPIDYRFFTVDNAVQWAQLDFKSPPPRVQGRAMLLGQNHLLLQGGCSPICDATPTGTMLSDMWMLSKPSDELGGWAALPEQDVNLWARVRFQTGADTSPGIRFFHTMLTELPENATGRSAILFGGAIPQPLSSPVFNYEVWRLTLDDTLSAAGEREATASWSRVPVDDQGSIINHPPVIGHSATMDANGNMMVFGGYDGYLLQHTGPGSCKLTSSLWRLGLAGSRTGGSARWGRMHTSSSSDPAVPQPRLHHECAFLAAGSPSGGPMLWCHGGVSCANKALDDTWGFDLRSSRWTFPDHTSSPGRRAAFSLTPVSDTKLLLTGGFADIETEDPVGDVWILDTSCKGVLARWHEIFPADPLALMQHSGVHLGGGLVAMVAGELHERPAAPWVLSHTWSIEAEGDVIDMHITNALSLMDTQECAAAAGTGACSAEPLGSCTVAPFSAALMVELRLPTGGASGGNTSAEGGAGPTCVMTVEGVDVLVVEAVSGAVLRTCLAPTAPGDGGGSLSAGCAWRTSGSANTVLVPGVGLRGPEASVSVRAVYNGVVLAETQPLAIAGNSVEAAAQTVTLQLEPPAVLTFWLRSGSDPLPAVLTTLLRCLTEDLCVPAYEVAPSGLAPGCIPAATNTYGAAEFSVWPPLQDTAYGFRVKVQVDGISYYSRRIPPQNLFPGMVSSESLAIPSGITAAAEVLLMLSGIPGLAGTHQRVWPDVELRLMKRSTAEVVAVGSVGLDTLTNAAYESLVNSPDNTWPAQWKQTELEIDLQAEYILHAAAPGSGGLYLLATSTQSRGSSTGGHTLTFQAEIQFMLVRLRLVFPSCLERWAACASGSRPVPSALALATTGLVTVRQHDLSAPMYDARGSRRLAQANYASYTWEHGARSDGEGYVQLGLFHSDVLEGAPPLKLRLSFGDQLIAPIMDIPRRKVVDYGTITATSPLLCIGQDIAAMHGSFPVSDLMQLADPRPAVPPGHVCRYNLRPPWTIGSSGTLEVLVYHHLMLDDDELILMPMNSGSVLFTITCTRRGCGKEDDSPYRLVVRASRMDVVFQAGQNGPKAEQDVTGFMVKYTASSASMQPDEQPVPDSGTSGGQLEPVSNRVLIEVMTAGVVSIVLLLLIICCVWKLCWLRARNRAADEAAMQEAAGSMDTYMELMGIHRGIRRRTGWENTARGHGDWQAAEQARQHRRRRGVPSGIVASLPTQKFVAEVPAEGEEAEEPDCCSICLEDYVDGAMLKILPCAHKFHNECIKAWLHRNATCPLCKHVLYEQPRVEVVELMPNVVGVSPGAPAAVDESPPARLVGAVNRGEEAEGGSSNARSTSDPGPPQ